VLPILCIKHGADGPPIVTIIVMLFTIVMCPDKITTLPGGAIVRNFVFLTIAPHSLYINWFHSLDKEIR